MIEVEVKLKIRDSDDVEAGLKEQGFRAEKILRETDLYLDNESGEIRKNGQALRIRKIVDCGTGEELSVMTFKGAKLDSVSMARRELETAVGAGDTALGILEALGYHPVSPHVVKERKLMLCGNVCACLDDVKDLGAFLELEIMAENEGQRAAALERIESILGNLGHKMEETTRKSYLSLLQKRESGEN